MSLPTACLEAGKESRDLSLVIESLQKHPSAGAYSTLGALFTQDEQLTCAIASFRQALQLEPTSWQTRYNLGLALLSRQEYKQAAEEFRTVTKQKPDFFGAHNDLGLALKNLGDLEAAAQEFEEALKIKPGFVGAASNLAQIYHEQKKYPAEIHYLRQSLASNPTEELVYPMRLALGIALENNGDTDAALAELRTLVIAYPRSVTAHYNLAALYARHKDFRESQTEFEACLRLDPENDTARLALAKTLTDIGDNAGSLPLLEEYIRRVPEDSEGHLVLGDVYRNLGEVDKAIRQLQTAADLKPNDFEVQYRLGMVLARAKYDDEAMAHLEIAGKLNPQAPEVPYQLALIYQKQGQPQKAAEEFRAFEKANQGSKAADKAARLGVKANALLEEGEAAEAVDTTARQSSSGRWMPGCTITLPWLSSDWGGGRRKRSR